MYDKLPQFVYINRKRYLINTDYRLFIYFETEMQGDDKKKVIIKTLSNFYPAFSEIVEKNLLEEAIDKFLWFYLCGKNKKEIDEEEETTKKRAKRIYDYDFDSDLIWGAYWDRGIDLTKNYLHWWKFRALWNSMPDDCKFVKVMGYRCYEGKDEDRLKLKEIYKLPPTIQEINEKKRLDNIYNQLLSFS